MGSEHSDQRSQPRRLPVAIKILIAGGFGVGKTTLVGAVSETQPLRTEELLTDQGVGVDDLSGVEAKNTTTVAMDFGRITIRDEFVLYLFGTPGQERFWFMWDELRRLADCFPAVDYFERRGTPFVVAVNCFEGARRYELNEVRLALRLDPSIPIVLCDARHRESGKETLITWGRHAKTMRANPVTADVPAR